MLPHALQSAAEPGGICISGSVYDQIRNKLSLSFRSLGEQTFKNIPQPVQHPRRPPCRSGREACWRSVPRFGHGTTSVAA